jgi:radical SAM superfamily enzyme
MDFVPIEKLGRAAERDDVMKRSPDAPVPLLLVGMPCWDHTAPFHSLALVASIAREAGAQVRVHDVNVAFYRHVTPQDQKYWAGDYNDVWFSDDFPTELWSRYRVWLHEYLDRMLEDIDPAMVAFTVNMSTRAFSVYAARHIKSRRPDLPILFGGVDCFPKERGKRFLEGGSDRYCDIICQGEADLSFPKFLHEFAVTGDWKTRVSGFAYYDGGCLVDTGDTELPTLKEKFPPPAYDLLDLNQYTKPGSAPFFLTRGCPYRCHFCSETWNFKHFRSRVAEEAIEEILTVVPELRKYSNRPTFMLSDSILNADMRMLRRFVDLLLEHDVDIRWGGQAHIHPLMTTELIEKMARTGFTRVFWGIETGSQHVVDLMEKRYRVRDARRILRDCSRTGIEQHVPIILGFPGETPEDVAETIEFIFEHQDLPGCQVHLPCQVVITLNSTLHRRYAEFGLANTNYYEWSSTDGTNTLPLRIARRFVARQAHGNRSLSMEGLVDSEEILAVRLNDPVIGDDLYRILRAIYQRAGEIARFEESIRRWSEGGESPVQGTLQLVGRRVAAFLRPHRPLPLRDVWMTLDKESAEGRAKLYSLVLDSLRILKEKVASAGLSEKDPYMCAVENVAN